MLFSYVWLVSIVITGLVAYDKKRSVIGWVILSIFFGPIPLVIILLLPKFSPEAKRNYSVNEDSWQANSVRKEFEELNKIFCGLTNRLNNLETKINALQNKPLVSESVIATPSVKEEKSRVFSPAEKIDMETTLGRFRLNKAGISCFYWLWPGW